jgi:hypothetical protein
LEFSSGDDAVLCIRLLHFFRENRRKAKAMAASISSTINIMITMYRMLNFFPLDLGVEGGEGMHGPNGGPHSPLLPENDLVKKDFLRKMLLKG